VKCPPVWDLVLLRIGSSVAGYSRGSKDVSAEMGRIFIIKIRYQETTSESKLRRFSV
jgi:hypothetical protein